MKTAVILCSGGIDSVVTAHFVKKELSFQKLIILFFNYNQPQLNEERNASRFCSSQLGAKFLEVNLPLDFLEKTKKINFTSLSNTKDESQQWYVPHRNLLFLSYALSFSENLSKKTPCEIFVGFKNEGKEPYPDTTPEFIEQINKISKNFSTIPVKISAPLIELDKEDIISLGKKLGVPLEKTFSCYSPKNKKHCGVCLACRLRKAGFYWANIPDKTSYLK